MGISLNSFMTGLGRALLGSDALKKGREAADNLKLTRSNQQLNNYRRTPKFGLHNSKSFVSKQLGATSIS